MPQIVLKKLSETYERWLVIERVGEYDSKDTIPPAIGERILIKDEDNITQAYLVKDVEHVYAYVGQTLRLYHISVYLEETEPIDIHAYQTKKAPRTFLSKV